jgi:hypothetical protein
MEQLSSAPETQTSVLTWTTRVLTELDFRRAWQGETTVEIARNTIVTPLAREHLRDKGVALTWRSDGSTSKKSSTGWNLAVERNDPRALAVLKAISGEGKSPTILHGPGNSTRSQWYRSLAEAVSGSNIRGMLAFCVDPEVCICVAAKVAGVRPALAVTPAQTARVLITLGCNFVALETTGRTFYELRQMTRIVTESGKPEAPPELAAVLKEQDGRAHR